MFGYLVLFSCKIVACKMFFSIYFRENATNHQNILQESGGFGTLSEPGLLDKKYTFLTGVYVRTHAKKVLCETPSSAAALRAESAPRFHSALTWA